MAKKKREPKTPSLSNLPATIDEAEALIFARELILRLDAGGDVGSPFEGTESRHFLRKLLAGTLQTADGRMWLTDMARAGEEESQIVLQDALLEMKSRHIELPTELAYYDMQLTRADVVPARWGGPKKKHQFTRNILIAAVTAGVISRGHKPTGRSTRRRSACSIVAEALAVVHMALGVKDIERIWNAYGHLMPTARGFWNWLEDSRPLPS